MVFDDNDCDILEGLHFGIASLTDSIDLRKVDALRSFYFMLDAARRAPRQVAWAHWSQVNTLFGV
jgi:hypothetical protein